MRTKRHAAFALMSALIVWAVLTGPLGAAVPTARPEEIGLSSERLKRIGDLITRHIDARNISGAVTLVARNGRVGHFEAQGLMDLDARKPMQKDTIFRIMSMTKPVIGAAVLMVVEEGKVRLNDPVSRFIPEFRGQKVAVMQAAAAGRGRAAGPGVAAPAEPRFYTVPADRDITVRDLLTHTSGLLSGGEAGRAEATKVAATAKETLADYLPRLGAVPLDFQPGSRWAYSGAAGFDALARIVEVASGMPIDRFLKQRLFDPLGMKDTSFQPNDSHPRMVTNYRRGQSGLEKQQNPAFMNGVYFSGGGGLLSTAEDYFQFAQMLLNGGQMNGARVLSPRAVDLMRSVFAQDTLPGRPLGEGFGLSVRVVKDPVARNSFLSEGSFGWSGAYGTHFWVDPKEKLVGILMIQTPAQGISTDFENVVMQSVVGGGSVPGTN
jgi:CubicO group peptidase (beta-lactamase class C family)